MTRTGYVTATTVGVLAISVISVFQITPKLVWNASASVPIGLYRITPADRIEISDLVAVMPPEPVAGFMVTRGYIGRDVPILKHVMGLAGQRLCRNGSIITVDGVALGKAMNRDSRGRSLPDWQGCEVIADDELFLMNPAIGDSLDDRYFGPFPASTVMGRAIPMFTDEDGSGHFAWRASTR